MRALKLMCVLGGMLVILSGCAGLGRSGNATNDTENRWETMAALEADFDNKIIPNETSVSDLAAIGLGPESPNVNELEYFYVLEMLADITSRYSSNLPAPIQSCLTLEEKCKAVVFKIRRIENVGKEDPLQRLLMDKKIDERTGWEIAGTVFLQNGIVVYKAKKDVLISEIEESSDPGKLLENIFEDIFKDTVKTYIAP